MRRVHRGSFIEFDTASNSAVFLLTNGVIDRDGDSVDPRGGDFTEYAYNPVVCFNHDRADFPIGMSVPLDSPPGTPPEIWLDEVDGKPALLGRVYFSRVNPKAKLAAEMVREGSLRGCSITFLPEGVPRTNDTGGRYYERWKLLEWSICPIGSNPEARRLSAALSAALNAMAQSNEHAQGQSRSTVMDTTTNTERDDDRDDTAVASKQAPGWPDAVTNQIVETLLETLRRRIDEDEEDEEDDDDDYDDDDAYFLDDDDDQDAEDAAEEEGAEEEDEEGAEGVEGGGEDEDAAGAPVERAAESAREDDPEEKGEGAEDEDRHVATKAVDWGCYNAALQALTGGQVRNTGSKRGGSTKKQRATATAMCDEAKAGKMSSYYTRGKKKKRGSSTTARKRGRGTAATRKKSYDPLIKCSERTDAVRTQLTGILKALRALSRAVAVRRRRLLPGPRAIRKTVAIIARAVGDVLSQIDREEEELAKAGRSLRNAAVDMADKFLTIVGRDA